MRKISYTYAYRQRKQGGLTVEDNEKRVEKMLTVVVHEKGEKIAVFQICSIIHQVKWRKINRNDFLRE